MAGGSAGTKPARNIVRNVLMAGCAVWLLGAAPASAKPVQFDIPAQDLAAALNKFGLQSGREIAYTPETLGSKRSVAVRGDLEPQAALTSMLAGTGLTFREVNGKITIVAGAASDPKRAGAELAPGTQTARTASNLPARSADVAAGVEEVVVTGSRIERAGFNAPTPTTVLNAADLRQGDRPNIAAVLTDLPNVQISTAPTLSTGSKSGGIALIDLRGLGQIRTLTLLNNRRFIGSNNLNTVPMTLVKRVDVVTGGASAAWGSGAVAGVVNIILDDDLEGGRAGVQGGISSHGDAGRYGANGAYGAHFSDGRGHFMVSADYLKTESAWGRNDGSRPNSDSALFTPTTGAPYLARNVNQRNATPFGIVATGPLAGQAFNADGSLSPLALGSVVSATQMIGGDSRNLLDYQSVAVPSTQYSAFGRISYDLSDRTKVWVDASFLRNFGVYSVFPELITASATTGLVLSSTNPFLTPAQQAGLSAGGPTFRLGRFLGDIGSDGLFTLAYSNAIYDAAGGIEGSLGGSWKYSAYFGHGEQRAMYAARNQRITANFNNAIDAVLDPATGQIVCRVALTTPNTPCRPLNLFGQGKASAEAIGYAFGSNRSVTTTALDSGSASLRGDPFSTWAGPVSIAVGVEGRRESITTNYIDPLSAAGALAFENVAPLNGSFSVKEGFGEVVVPLLDAPELAKFEVNGAARYSDYSTTGGIWSWKTGATARLVDDVLVRTTVSRDIRSPSIQEMFTQNTIGIGNLLDPLKGNASVPYRSYTGGNPNLAPEIGHGLTLGGSYAPHFVPGLRLSVDYFRTRVDKAIGTLGAQAIVTQCAQGNTVLCGAVTRDASGNITLIQSTSLNLASYLVRGIDFEVSYETSLDRLNPALKGRIRFRGLATRVNTLQVNNGQTRIDRAGDVGSQPFMTPKWRATGSVSYDYENFGADLRVRYVGGGTYDHTLNVANNAISSQTYVDLGARYEFNGVTVYGSIDNLFDKPQPLIAASFSRFFDSIGRYVSGGVKVRF